MRIDALQAPVCKEFYFFELCGRLPRVSRWG